MSVVLALNCHCAATSIKKENEIQAAAAGKSVQHSMSTGHGKMHSMV
jgi:hypothetical protein